MQCLEPRTVGFKDDGKTIAWSKKSFSKQFATFQLPCGQCLQCRLNYARQWSIRCAHEAQMREKSCFVTLTYSDECLTGPKLIYSDFQKFMKRVRKLTDEKLGVFVTGEYGAINKRPHWHCLIFGWEPSDGVYHYSNNNGDKCYTSETLSKTWGLGRSEYGQVTFQSAGYCARYAAKKLVHGRDETHEFHPISKKSNKQAIGRSWIEKYYKDVFSYGYVMLPGGVKAPIPRYYEKWFKEYHPDEFLNYLKNVKLPKMVQAGESAAIVHSEYMDNVQKRVELGKFVRPITRKKSEFLILKSKFKLLQDNLKL